MLLGNIVIFPKISFILDRTNDESVNYRHHSGEDKFHDVLLDTLAHPCLHLQRRISSTNRHARHRMRAGIGGIAWLAFYYFN
ncbi:MAG: hypothetical protein NZM04_06385 [Methylacidiphilales bacterium]|nr:hypothetical protein [Candidatus Methylacidiphilales bacterium]MDW8350239.1 hypothetical protein [Verrucomicrobiae bacterium]